MTGTETAAAGGWLVAKLAPALGGLFGGLSLAMFWTPEKLREKGKVASIFIAGGISAMAGFSLTGIFALWLGVSPDKLDTVIGLAWLLGLGSIALMNWVANYMMRTENMDIGEAMQDIRAIHSGSERQSPNRKPAAKRVRKAPATKTTARKTVAANRKK